MKRTSAYFGLKWIVQCRWPQNSWFETIAAFDVDNAAQSYANNCAKNNTSLKYRVLERNSKGQFK